MDKKRVLFVDDELNILDGLKRSLRHMRQEWDTTFAHGGEAAQKILSEQPFDVIVSDMRMPVVDGVQLLTEVKQKYPGMVRIALSGQTSKEAMLRATGPIHQYLPKPCDVEKLKGTINRICGLRNLLKLHQLQRLTDQLESLPCLGSLYAKLVEELQQPDATISMIGRIISQDVGLTAKVLQTVNSAYFGLRRHITNIDEAVAMLGLHTIKIITLSMHVLAQFPAEDKNGFSPEYLQEHSMMVGMAAKAIMDTRPHEASLADTTLLAGLLHDVGKLVFATKIPEFFVEAMETADRQQTPPHQAEQEVIGADHAQVGAYLLGLWGFSEDIINAVAFHHQPQQYFNAEANPFMAPSSSPGVWVLTSVHAANALVHAESAPEGRPSRDKLDCDFLEHQGVADQLEPWKTLCQDMVRCGSTT